MKLTLIALLSVSLAVGEVLGATSIGRPNQPTNGGIISWPFNQNGGNSFNPFQNGNGRKGSGSHSHSRENGGLFGWNNQGGLFGWNNQGQQNGGINPNWNPFGLRPSNKDNSNENTNPWNTYDAARPNKNNRNKNPLNNRNKNRPFGARSNSASHEKGTAQVYPAVLPGPIVMSAPKVGKKN